MKNSWLLKILILSTALATLSGCPALSNFMDMISRELNKPKKTIEITGIPMEYEGLLISIMATDSADTLGERLCMSGGMDNRVVKDGSGKTSILEMNSQKANSQMSVLIAAAKNVTGTAKSCDERERIVAFSLLSFDSYDEENQNVDSLMGKILNNTFIYTKGVNICNASADVLSNTKLTYSLSEMETTLKFSDFMRASDCETLMEIVSSTSKGEMNECNIELELNLLGSNVDMSSEGFNKISTKMVDCLKMVKNPEERLKLINEMESSLAAVNSKLKQNQDIIAKQESHSCNEIDKIDNMINYLKVAREGNKVFPMLVDNLDWLGVDENLVNSLTYKDNSQGQVVFLSSSNNTPIHFFDNFNNSEFDVFFDKSKPDDIFDSEFDDIIDFFNADPTITLKELREKIMDDGLEERDFLKYLSFKQGILILKNFPPKFKNPSTIPESDPESEMMINIAKLFNENVSSYPFSGHRVNIYEFNPNKEKIVLTWNEKAEPEKENGLESLKDVYEEYRKPKTQRPKVIINAGFFDKNKGKNISIGWTYSDSLNFYESNIYKNTEYDKTPSCKAGQIFEALIDFLTLVYYKNGSSEVFKTCDLTNKKFQEKTKDAIFVISGNNNLKDINNNIKRARTIIGVKNDGTIILWTIDEMNLPIGGLSSLTVSDAMKKIQDMGVDSKKILNLDGGGSTQFFLYGQEKTRNKRDVGSRFLIFDN